MIPAAPQPRYRGFFVAGKPAPQGSKRHVGRGRLVESCNALPMWREKVAFSARGAIGCRPPLEGAVRLHLGFAMPRPKNLPKTVTPPAIKRPDLDKLIRAIADAITGVLIKDDAQIAALHATKWICEIDEVPGVYISVEKL